jgi:hypothetical protein
MITVDCGFKGFASESIPPTAIDLPAAKYRFAGDEHGMLLLGDGAQEPLLEKTDQFRDAALRSDGESLRLLLGASRRLRPRVVAVSARGCSW